MNRTQTTTNTMIKKLIDSFQQQSTPTTKFGHNKRDKGHGINDSSTKSLIEQLKM